MIKKICIIFIIFFSFYFITSSYVEVNASTYELDHLEQLDDEHGNIIFFNTEWHLPTNVPNHTFITCSRSIFFINNNRIIYEYDYLDPDNDYAQIILYDNGQWLYSYYEFPIIEGLTETYMMTFVTTYINHEDFMSWNNFTYELSFNCGSIYTGEGILSKIWPCIYEDQLPVLTQPGYDFLGWYKLNNTNDYIFIDIADDIIFNLEKDTTLYARWSPRNDNGQWTFTYNDYIKSLTKNEVQDFHNGNFNLSFIGLSPLNEYTYYSDAQFQTEINLQDTWTIYEADSFIHNINIYVKLENASSFIGPTDFYKNRTSVLTVSTITSIVCNYFSFEDVDYQLYLKNDNYTGYGDRIGSYNLVYWMKYTQNDISYNLEVFTIKVKVIEELGIDYAYNNQLYLGNKQSFTKENLLASMQKLSIIPGINVVFTTTCPYFDKVGTNGIYDGTYNYTSISGNDGNGSYKLVVYNSSIPDVIQESSVNAFDVIILLFGFIALIALIIVLIKNVKKSKKNTRW